MLLQFGAHLLSDFTFQPQSLSDKKESKILSKYHIYHIIIVGILSYILSFSIGFWKAALVISIVHLLTDMLKSWFMINHKTKNYFFIDQLIHIIVIVIIVIVYSRLYNIEFLISFKTRTIAIVVAFIFCSKPSNILIKHIFSAFSVSISVEDPENKDELSLPNAGKLIGIVERFLALSLIIIGQYEAVGLIIAAKSILRFNGTQKSEYVLVGTLLSFGIAVFCGILINLI